MRNKDKKNEMNANIIYEKETFKHGGFSQTLDKMLTYFIVICVSAGVSGLMVFGNVNILAALFLMIGVAVMLLTFYRVDWGFYIFFGLIMFLDQFGIPKFDPITFRFDYFKNLKEISYIPSFSAAVLNPLEVQLLLLLLAWFIAVSVNKKTKVQHVTIWGLAIIFLLTLVASLIHGLKTGGVFLPALWELRAFFYFSFLYFFVPQIIQSKEQIKTLMWVFIAGVSFKAFQGIERFVKLGLSFRGMETLTNHEDPVFITLLVLFLLALILFDAKEKHRTALIWLLFPLLMGFFTGQRRAAYGGLIVSFAGLIILLSSRQRAIFFKVLTPFLIVGAIYSAVFWNSESKLASPVSLLKSSFFTDKSDAGERYLSNLYRKFERYDLAYTVKSSPVTGLGFGKKYEMPIPLAQIPFPLRDFIPHNEVLWLLVKMGGVGFFVFWFFFDSLLFRGSTLCVKLKDPFLKAVCAIIVVSFINQIAVSFYDLQLTYYRNMVLLGTLWGLLPTLQNLNREEEIKREKELMSAPKIEFLN